MEIGIKGAVKRILCKILPAEDTIAFESYPDFCGNSLKVFERLYHDNNKYQFIWFIHNNSPESLKYTNIKLVKVDYKNVFEKVKYFYTRFKCKIIISENYTIGKLRNDQICIL